MRLRISRAARLGAVLVGVAVLVGPVGIAGAASGHQPIATAGSAPGGAITNESPRAWLVELSGSAADFRADAKAVGLKYASDTCSS